MTLRRSPTFASVWAGTTPLNPACFMYAAIADSIRCIHDREAALLRQCGEGSPAEQVTASCLPSSAAHFVAHFQAQPSDTLIQPAVQHRNNLLKQIAGRTVAARDRSPAGIANVARLEALRSVHASRWLLQPVRDGVSRAHGCRVPVGHTCATRAVWLARLGSRSRRWRIPCPVFSPAGGSGG